MMKICIQIEKYCFANYTDLIILINFHYTSLDIILEQHIYHYST